MATNFLIINLPHNMQDEFKQRQDKHVMNAVEKTTVIHRMTRIVEHQGPQLTTTVLLKKERPVATFKLSFILYVEFLAYPFVSAPPGKCSGSFDLKLQDGK